MTFYQGYSNKSDPLKNMATRGVACFPYTYRVKTLKTIEVLLNQVSDIGPSWPSCLNLSAADVLYERVN